MKRPLRVYLPFLAIICILFWLIFPMGVDTPFHILRIGELGKELSRDLAEGRCFPVYMYRDVYNHFGYPIPIFYCSVFLYPFACLTLIGSSATAAYKLFVVITVFLSFIISSICVKCVSKYRDICYDAAFFYTVQPFFLCELIYRGSIGAALVFVFIPVVLLGIYMIVTGDQWKPFYRGILCLGGGMAGILMSHVISAVIISISLVILLIAVLFRTKKRLRILCSVVLSAILCFLLTMWYICPMLEQLIKYQYRGQTVTYLQQGTVEPIAMILPVHLSVALSAIMHTDVPKAAIGGCVVPILIFTVYSIITGRICELRLVEWILLIIYYLLNISLMVDVIWRILDSSLSFMQFSWRFYPVVSVIGAMLLILSYGRSTDWRFRRGILIISIFSAIYSVVFVLAFFAVRNIAPAYISAYSGHEVVSYDYSSETSDELYLPYMMNPDALRRASRIVSCDCDAISYTYVIDEESGCVYSDIMINNSDVECVMTFPFIMYNGYVAMNEDDGSTYIVRQGQDGLTDVIIPPGATGRVRVSYTGTLTQRVSYYVSLISFVIMVGSNLIHVEAKKRYV